MASQLKLRRGTTAQHSTFTGASGEITVDTTKKTVVVHDGTTAGGNPVLSAAAGAVGTSNIADAAVTASKLAVGAAAANLGFTPVNKAGDTLTGALNEAPFATLASATTVNIGAASSNNISITGTTTITAFDSIAAGAVRRLVFAGALTLTHNATSLILPSGANITTAAGDVAQMVSLGSGNWRCVNYMRANGQPVVSSAGGVTSAVAGNGIAVSGATGAVTFSLAGPSFNSVGSYAAGFVSAPGTTQPGGTLAAGSSNGQFRVNNTSGTNQVSGTWRLMGNAVFACPCSNASFFGVRIA